MREIKFRGKKYNSDEVYICNYLEDKWEDLD